MGEGQTDIRRSGRRTRKRGESASGIKRIKKRERDSLSERPKKNKSVTSERG